MIPEISVSSWPVEDTVPIGSFQKRKSKRQLYKAHKSPCSFSHPKLNHEPAVLNGMSQLLEHPRPILSLFQMCQPFTHPTPCEAVCDRAKEVSGAQRSSTGRWWISASKTLGNWTIKHIWRFPKMRVITPKSSILNHFNGIFHYINYFLGIHIYGNLHVHEVSQDLTIRHWEVQPLNIGKWNHVGNCD